MDGDKLSYAQHIAGHAMDDILAVFKPGAKITVMVRRPGKPDQDFLMTNDDLGEAALLIQRRIEAGPN